MCLALRLGHFLSGVFSLSTLIAPSSSVCPFIILFIRNLACPSQSTPPGAQSPPSATIIASRPHGDSRSPDRRPQTLDRWPQTADRSRNSASSPTPTPCSSTQPALVCVESARRQDRHDCTKGAPTTRGIEPVQRRRGWTVSSTLPCLCWSPGELAGTRRSASCRGACSHR